MVEARQKSGFFYLRSIGDTFAIAAFNSAGRQQVYYHIVKDFNEPWNNITQSRIPAIRPAIANRDGCAIQHSTRKLLEQPNKTKLLLLLSDGIPADAGYGGSSGAETNDYAIEDTRRALIECRQTDLVPFCLTIDSSARDYISRLYSDYHYSLLNDINLLPQQLSKLYLRLTR
ncbi:MAG: hypothetical protein KAU17_16540 [Spirochaetales bacterium]|nr:hypothetical protein [Spirochaetales bacterium]